MLDKMRDNSRSFIIYFFFTILILVFVFEFGPQSGGWQPTEATDVASVLGDKIDQSEVDMEYIRNYGWGSARNSELADVLRQKRELLDHLVQVRLLAREAEDMGLVATSEETVAYIQDPLRNFDFRSFAPDGEFDADQYQRIVQNAYQSSLRRYEAGRQRDLLTRRLLSFLGGQVRVTEDEVATEWKLRNTKVNLEFIAFRAEAEPAPAPPTEAAVAAWAKDEADAVKAWYEGHKDDYVRPKEVQIRQIFVRGPKGDAALRAKAKTKAEGIHKRVAGGEDMATVARAESDHVSYKDKGGDMGWQRAGNNDPDFDKAAFALTKGALAEVVETEIGFFVLRAEDVRDATSTTLAEATPDIARKQLSERLRRDAAKARAQALLTKARAGASFADLVRDLNAPAEAEIDDAAAAGEDKWSTEETGEFAQDGGTGAPDPANPFRFRKAWDTVPRIGRSAALSRAAFSLTKASPLPEGPVEVDGTWYATRLKERSEPDQATYAQDREALSEELRTDRIAAVLGPWQRSLFTPKQSLRFFGGAPSHGPWLSKVLDAAQASAAVTVNDSAFQVKDSPSAVPTGAPGPTSAAVN